MTRIIVVDPDDGGTQTGTQLPPPAGFQRTPIRERLGEPIDAAGECRVLDGKPCILFADWDYGEDWSGEFVREVHPFTLVRAQTVTVDEFWERVRAIAPARDAGWVRYLGMLTAAGLALLVLAPLVLPRGAAVIVGTIGLLVTLGAGGKLVIRGAKRWKRS